MYLTSFISISTIYEIFQLIFRCRCFCVLNHKCRFSILYHLGLLKNDIFPSTSFMSLLLFIVFSRFLTFSAPCFYFFAHALQTLYTKYVYVSLRNVKTHSRSVVKFSFWFLLLKRLSLSGQQHVAC